MKLSCIPETMLFECLCLLMLILTDGTYDPTTYCLNLAGGSHFVEMDQLTSSNSVLKVIMKFNTNFVEQLVKYCYIQHHKKLRTFSQSPTLRLYPGEKLIVKLINQVPESYNPLGTLTDSGYCLNKTATTSSTNLHFHGLEIAPTCQDDNTLMTVVNAFEAFFYDIDIPFSQPPGLYWYHPHIHMTSTAQVGGGASGALVVEGIERVQPAVAGMWEQVMVFRQGLEGPLTLNYVEIASQPVQMSIKPNQTQFWRIINAGVEEDLNLTLVYDGIAQNFTVIALDGVVVGTGETAESYVTQSLFIATAARAEVVIRAPNLNQSAVLINIGHATPLINLTASIDAPDPINKLPELANLTFPAFVRISTNLLTMEPVAKHLLRFTQNLTDPNNLRWYITADKGSQQLFQMNAKPSIVSYQGTVEDWTITNETPQSHNFHIHQMHFIPLAQDGMPLPIKEQQYRDVILVPGQSYDPVTGELVSHNVTIRMDFTREAVAGSFVYHCHILLHEDHGMMAVIQVKPLTQSPTSLPSATSSPMPSSNSSSSSNSTTITDITDGGWDIFYVVYLSLALVVIAALLATLVTVSICRIMNGIT